MHDDDIICGTCGKRNEPARVTCWSCKEALEEETSSGGGGGKIVFNLILALALLVVVSMLIPVFTTMASMISR